MIVERDGPCVIERNPDTGVYRVSCHDCHFCWFRRSRRDAEDLFDRHTHGEAE